MKCAEQACCVDRCPPAHKDGANNFSRPFGIWEVGPCTNRYNQLSDNLFLIPLAGSSTFLPNTEFGGVGLLFRG